MVITSIEKLNIACFAPLLLSDIASLIEADAAISALGVITDGVACAALAGYVEENTFSIRSLYVAEEYRRKGIATALLKKIKEVLVKNEKVETITVLYTITDKEHEALQAFLKKAGFLGKRNDETIYASTLGSIAKLPYFMKLGSETKNKNILSFAEIPDIYIRQLDRKFTAMEESILGIPLEEAALDKDLSIGIVADGEIKAFILFDHSFAGKLTLTYAYAGDVEKGAASFLNMIMDAFQRGMKKYTSNTEVVINAATEFSAKLLKRIIGESQDFKILSFTEVLTLREGSIYYPPENKAYVSVENHIV